MTRSGQTRAVWDTRVGNAHVAFVGRAEPKHIRRTTSTEMRLALAIVS